MDNTPVNEFQCPYCGSPIIINPEANHDESRCLSCHKSFIVFGNPKHLISKELVAVGDAGLLQIKEKKSWFAEAVNFMIGCWNKVSGLKAGVKVGLASAAISLIAAFVIIKIATRPEPIENCMAYTDVQETWETFRSNNPYNIQTVGIKEYEDGSFTLIITEPSEFVTEKAIRKFMKKYNHHAVTKKCRIGIDGWMKDVVGCFSGVKDMEKFKSELFKLLYGTDYKAYFCDLNENPRHVDFAEENLNYQISAEELRSWFIDGEETFIVDGEREEKLTKLIVLPEYHKSMSVVYSSDPGFVAWILPKKGMNNKDFNRYARIFALDSDLILGAIKALDCVAIIGRERTTPVETLPPMRVETMRMLAQTAKSELSQSYERNHLFAGKEDTGWDLAPILLSDELWHTEYGSILNVTDQMLKSWSENGQINYYEFGYTHPTDWAFENGALSDLGTNKLTYNWNTAGAGYVVEGDTDCPYDIYALNRTGSLPVSYIPGDTDKISVDDQVYQFEEKAYDFFSNLSSPELVKVAEYAALYQIFTNFELKLPPVSKPNYNTPNTDGMRDAAASILIGLRDYNPEDDAKVKEYLRERADYYHHGADSLRAAGEQEIAAHAELYASRLEDPEVANIYTSTFDSLKTVIKGLNGQNDTYLKRVAHYVVNPRSINYGYISAVDYYLTNPNDYLDEYHPSASSASTTSRYGTASSIGNSSTSALINTMPSINIPTIGTLTSTQNTTIPSINITPKYTRDQLDAAVDEILSQLEEDEKAMLDAFRIADNKDDFVLFGSIMSLPSMDEILKDYVKSNEEVANHWIKCPTIVCSFSHYGGTGGHNLSSKITPVKVDRTLAKGQFKVENVGGKKVISVSAVDKGRITPGFLRQVERTGIKGTNTFTAEARAVRPRKLVLANVEKRTARGFNTADHVHVRREAIGFRVNEKAVSSMDDLFVELESRVMSGEGLSGKTITFENFNDSHVRLIMDNVDQGLVNKGFATKFDMAGYDLSAIEYDTSLAAEGITTVKIPIKPSTARIAPDGETIEYVSKNIFKKIYHSFKMPNSSVNRFVARFKSFIKDKGGNVWNDFLFKQDLKRNGINAYEIDEAFNYIIAQILALSEEPKELLTA